jgi:CRP-like cAMP-binding protein
MTDKTVKQLKKFFSAYPLAKFKKGRTIKDPNSKSVGVMFIKRGYARAYSLSENGRERTIPMFRPLFPCAAITLLTKKKNDFYFEAISTMEVWEAPEKEFVAFLEENKQLKEELTRGLMMELAEMVCEVQSLISGDATNKVATLIASMAKKFGEKEGKGVKVKFDIPHRILASMAGLTRETVTLQILEMEKKKLIVKKGRSLVVTDMEKMTNLT